MNHPSELAPQPTHGRPLEQIGAAVEELAGVEQRLERFIQRFNGAGQTKAAGVATAGQPSDAQVAYTYRDRIGQLSTGIEAINARLATLEELG